MKTTTPAPLQEAVEEVRPARNPEFDELLLKHANMLYAVALKLTHNPVDAQDLVHDTIIKALRFHDKFQKGSYIKGWLLTILRNTFINNYRAKARRPAMVELSGTELARETFLDPEVPVVLTEPRRRYSDLVELLDDNVRQAIEELPEEFQTTLIMCDLEDWSYKDIAKATKCPLGTVMSRLHRGRKLLREKLRDYAANQGIGKTPGPNLAA